MAEKCCVNQETKLGPSHWKSKLEERKDSATGSGVTVMKEDPAEQGFPVPVQGNERGRDSDPDDDHSTESPVETDNDWPSVYNPLAVMRVTPDFLDDVPIMDPRTGVQRTFESLEAVCKNLVTSGEWNAGYILKMQLINAQNPNDISLSVQRNVEESAGRDLLDELVDQFANLQIQRASPLRSPAEWEAEIRNSRLPVAERLRIRIRFLAIDFDVWNHDESVALFPSSVDEYVNRLERDGFQTSLNCTHRYRQRNTCERFLGHRPTFHNFIIRQDFNCGSHPVIFGIMCTSPGCKAIFIGCTTKPVVERAKICENARQNHFNGDHRGAWKFTPLVYASPIKKEMLKVRKAFQKYFRDNGFDLVHLEPQNEPDAN